MDTNDLLIKTIATECDYKYVKCTLQKDRQSIYYLSIPHTSKRVDYKCKGSPCILDSEINPCAEIPQDFTITISIKDHLITITNPLLVFNLYEPDSLQQLKDALNDPQALLEQMWANTNSMWWHSAILPGNFATTIRNSWGDKWTQ